MKDGKCQLCGEVGPLTRDHIPQLGLYPKVVRSAVPNMNTMSACGACNNAAKIVDEVLKVFVGFVADAPWYAELMKSAEATLQKNQRLARALNTNVRIEQTQDRNGNPIDARVIKLPKEETDQLIQALERIARALFFQEFGKVLTEEHEISVFYPQVIHRDLYRELEDALMAGEWKHLNAGTMHYCFVSINNGDICCVVNIYKNIEFCFCIRPKDWRDNLPAIKPKSTPPVT
jgi:hypothetical protein